MVIKLVCFIDALHHNNDIFIMCVTVYMTCASSWSFDLLLSALAIDRYNVGLSNMPGWTQTKIERPDPSVIQSDQEYKTNIVAAFRGMHVSPAKHSYAWLPRKCDYRTDRHTHTQTDAGQSDPYVPLCFAGDTINGYMYLGHLVTEIMEQNIVIKQTDMWAGVEPDDG